ncbi:hypothetical protein RDB90_005220 [Salmonella enterica]|uniref:Uncharacterized protein n=1 Tax=Salmonella enterica TaxID=28901 RepID=A0A759MCD0_SALER|nr:hypothetical protein [Salmonella enterica]EBR9623523.1 hypothetical protein [Salmonella enterica subsp. enterica serovar Montevideo]ECY7784958.1 hypothetical protein [Salmonella enterica subsp. enterica serovar Anatum]EDR9713698.1 hypothetical protein [Salmonella enterica subsp. diarizonae]MJZ70829.1 hypothetical protein [Salmonella enterica subsp. enterica]
MGVLFENINKNTKGNKKFILKIIDNGNDNYVVIQQTFAYFPDSGEVLQSEKKEIFSSLAELREGKYTRTRQGRLFIMSDFWTTM